MRTTYVSDWIGGGLARPSMNELEAAHQIKTEREQLEWTAVQVEKIEKEMGRYRVTVSGLLPELKPRESWETFDRTTKEPVR